MRKDTCKYIIIDCEMFHRKRTGCWGRRRGCGEGWYHLDMKVQGGSGRELSLKNDSSDLGESVKSQRRMFQADKPFSCVGSYRERSLVR